MRGVTGKDPVRLIRAEFHLRKRHGDIPVRVRRAGKKRWTRGHAIWVSDVFVWRGSPAAWNEDVLQVSGAAQRAAGTEEIRKLRRLGEGAVITSLGPAEGEPLDVATAADRGPAALGPFEERSIT